MINCPRCQQTLPDWAQTCQFCGSDLKGVQRPVQPKAKRQRGFQTAKWIWPAYYACAGYFILNGLLETIGAIAVAGTVTKTPFGNIVNSVNYVGVVVGVLTIVVGIGLILKVEFIRGVVNFFCGISILISLLTLIPTILGSALVGLYGIVYIVRSLLSILTNGLMIYLIGETD